MGVVAVLLDKCKETRSLATDMALSAALGVKRQTVAQWRSGTTYPDDDHIARLIDLAKVGPEWVLLVESERHRGATAKHWQALARKLGAAAVLGAVALFAGFATPTVQATPARSGPSIHYAHCRRWLKRWLTRGAGPNCCPAPA